jgi:hypothetical protein
MDTRITNHLNTFTTNQYMMNFLPHNYGKEDLYAFGFILSHITWCVKFW